MEAFTKIVRLGTTQEGARRPNVYCKIKFEKNNLSITGVVGPMSNGNCIGSCGQIEMSMEASDITPRLGITPGTLQKFFEVWREWHLNDMQAGTPAQEAELKKHKFPGYPVDHFDWAKETLTKAGLQPDNGYSYGSKWLRIEVPDEVLEFLKSLPDTDKEPAWV